jgi:hypothetical protein
MTTLAHYVACYLPRLSRQRVGGLTFMSLTIGSRTFVASFCESRKAQGVEV